MDYFLACIFNTNVNIIKFLVNDLKFDINRHKEKIYLIVCSYNKNIDIIKYLIRIYIKIALKMIF